MIKEHISIHDQYQFEIKLGYPLSQAEKTTKYDIETYLFFPYTLGINRHTYQKDDFYADIQAYIRLSPPGMPLPDLVTGDESPLAKLQQAFRQVISQKDTKAFANYEYHVKMFCCILKTILKEHVSFFTKRPSPDDKTDVLENYLHGIQQVTQAFRALRSELNSPAVTDNIFSLYVFGDEYMSIYIEMYSYELLEHLQESEIDEADRYQHELLTVISDELEYRKTHRYPSIPKEDTENEYLLFRKSVLKKYMENVLFLHTHTSQTGRVMEQILASLAAGLAMVFATAIAFFSKSVYGNLSFPLFMALVVGYMFKDRIKHAVGAYFKARMQRTLFDHKMKISAKPNGIIGWCKERVDFVRDQQVPEMVLKIRDRRHITEIENEHIGEKIIRYRKRIKLFNPALRKVYHDFPLERVTDIMRVNVRAFLEKMDNPTQPVYIYRQHGNDYRKISGNRVYHLNLIEKFTSQKNVTYKRFRIVLNRNGIQRIETVTEET